MEAGTAVTDRRVANLHNGSESSRFCHTVPRFMNLSDFFGVMNSEYRTATGYRNE